MQALRLHEVLARVVAWHNRHPLARRINASQVHSIGEVLLPFASAEALATGETAAPASAKAITDAPPALPAWRPRAAPAPNSAQAGPPAAPLADAPAAEAPQPAAPTVDVMDQDDGDVELEIDIDLLAGDDASAVPGDAATDQGDGEAALELPPPGADATAAAETTAADPFDLPELQDQAPPARPASEAPEASAVDAPSAERSDASAYTPRPDMATSIAAEPLHAPVPEADSAPPPARGLRRAGTAPAIDAPRPTGLRRLLLALRTTLTGRQPGMPRLQAVFSRNFIWPLTPSQVARWAQRHGQAQALAPADWPRRQVDTDGQRLAQARQKGLAHTLQLHVLTAAIGVGDRRIRVLMDAQGAVIGPRAYSRPRVVGATSLLMAGMLAVGWGLWRPAHEVGTDTAVAAALVASAPASAAASATDGPASASLVAAGAAAEAPVAAMVLLPAASVPEGPAAATASAPEVPHPASAGPTAQAPDLPQPPGPASSTPEQPVARIRPTLSTEQRQVARLQGERLRTSPPAAATAPAPVYAVVTRPSRERESAVRGLALMRDSSRRLPPPLPDHGELMRSQGEWRAAWWPFASLADAERARVMLNGRGLKAEVVAF